ncbi:MAG: hypothetical protein IJY38_03650 [Clostridia bacterium]|nr:hypothetical protein [Clostridia bacterium]
MKIAHLLEKIRFYGLKVLLLGLLEKILAALTKYASSLQEKLNDAVERRTEKNAARALKKGDN